MNRLYEDIFPVNVLLDDTLGNSSDTARVNLGHYRRAMFHIYAEPTTTGDWVIDNDGPEQIQVTLKEADDVTTGDTDDLDESAREFNAGMGVLKMKINATDQLATGDIITINGVEFEKVSSNEDAEAGTWTTDSHLKAAIDANIKGVTTSTGTNDVTVEVIDYQYPMTVELDTDETGADEEIQIEKAAAVVEVHLAELSDGKDYVYLTVDDNTASHDPESVDVTVTALLGNAYSQPVNQTVL